MELIMALKYSYKKPDRTEKILIFIAILSLAISILYLFLSQKTSLPSTSLPEFYSIPDLSTQGYIKTQPDVFFALNQGIVTLIGDCYRLTANTEIFQAESIVNGLAGKVDFRPNTHDLMKDALNALGIEVLMVKIVDIKNNTFFGKLILKQGDKIISLDSKPSDGIALAVRTNSSIYVKEDLMKSRGENIC